MAKRKKKPPYRGRSPAELAELFNRSLEEGARGDEADELFVDEVSARLRARALGPEVLEAALAQIPPNARAEFFHSCEVLAAEEDFGLAEDPDYLQLLVIPVYGPVDEIAETFEDRDVLLGLSSSVGLAGYAAPGSYVALCPWPMPAVALGLLDPTRIRDLLLDISAQLSGAQGSGAVRRLEREVHGMVADLRDPDEIVLGVRFLIGARVSGPDELGDGLFPDLEEPDDAFIAREMAWDTCMTDLLGPESPMIVEPPVSWDEARAEILICGLRQGVYLALATEGVASISGAADEITSEIMLDPEALHIRLLFRGRELSEVTIDLDLVGPVLDQLVETIEFAYPLNEEEQESLPVTIH